MARYRGQKALYEVIDKTRLKPSEPGSVGPLRASSDSNPGSDATLQKAEEPVPESTVPSPAVRWQRPRPVQFNAGRLELTIPYPIAVAIVLALVLVVLAAYRWGQSNIVPGP